MHVDVDIVLGRLSDKPMITFLNFNRMSFKFICIPIYILAGPGFSKHLAYRHSRQKKKQTNLEDIYDGSLYKQLCIEGELLSTHLRMFPSPLTLME